MVIKANWRPPRVWIDLTLSFQSQLLPKISLSFLQVWNCRKHKCNRGPGEKIGHPVQWSGYKHDQVLFYFLCFGVWGRWKSHYCRTRGKGKRVCERTFCKTDFFWKLNVFNGWHCESLLRVSLKSVLSCHIWSVYYSIY